MPDPKLAAAIRVTQCDCGCKQVIFSMVDHKGEIFAVAIFDEDSAETLADDILDLVEEEDDGIGEVVGHA